MMASSSFLALVSILIRTDRSRFYIKRLWIGKKMWANKKSGRTFKAESGID